MDEEQQSMTSASTSSKQQNNTAVTFGSTTEDTSSGTKDDTPGRQKMSSPDRKLSMVSRMYDIDGDGQLGKCVYYDCNISCVLHYDTKH